MNIDNFRVPEGAELDLGRYETAFTDKYTNKVDAEKDLKSNIKKLSRLQRILYADNKHAILIIFQAMDAAGKDGTIRHVMSGLNPQGCQVFSFKQPSHEELDHDYLWRCVKALPERGRIGIFNRSYYEDVLVVRVHPEILASSPLPDKIKNDPNIWETRFDQIRNFERHLAQNGTHILKFFLNVSKQEQRKRFLARIDTPEKNWKFSASDVKERGYWDDYQHAYTDAIQATSTDESPWFVIPADNKWFMRLAVSEVIDGKLDSLDLKYPTLSSEHLERLQEAKVALENEA